MSKEEVLKEISALLDQKLTAIIPRLETPQVKTMSGGSGDTHKTLVEMIDCPTCSKGFKEKMLELFSQKECKECGFIGSKKEEYCEDCGEQY